MLSIMPDMYALVVQICVLAFAIAVVLAALSDLHAYSLPNVLSVIVAVLWFPYAIGAGFSMVAIAGFVAIAASVLMLGILGWNRGLVGGGDAKLFAAVALWAGPAGIATLVLQTAIAGGVLSLIWLFSTPVRHCAILHGATIDMEPPGKIPYGLAIAAGGVFLARRLIAE